MLLIKVKTVFHPSQILATYFNFNFINQRNFFVGFGKVAEDLIKRGANINHKNKYGATPLIIAALTGPQSFIEFLIEHGADINAVNKRHDSILFLTIHSSKII